MPGSVARPSTANTMCLVLKPKIEEYRHATPILGSESEREAWRKNRVIQMKLGAYLTEIQQQQQSCARLMKTEEYRFMQEATRRSSVPRSVEMLQQLHFFHQKHLSGARYTYGMSPPRDGHSSLHHHHHGVHKHPPLSARALRPHRQTNGLNRPKTSATLYRKSLDCDGDNMADMADGRLDFETASVHKGETNREQIFDLVENVHPAKYPHQPSCQTSELPAITMKDNYENVFPPETLINRGSTPRQGTMSIDTARKVLSEGKTAITLPKAPFASKQRTESNSSSVSKYPQTLQRMNSVSKFSSSELPLQGKLPELDRESVGSSHADTNMVSTMPIPNENDEPDYEDDVIVAEAETLPANEFPAPILTGSTALEGQDLKLDIAAENDDDLDIATHEGPDFDSMPPVEKMAEKRPQKPAARKTTFNRIRTEPVMPLRHNITSVLRQEKAKYEANQLKVKDYIHKMSSRDTISRSNPREHSAASRRSSARITDQRSESRNMR